MDPQLLPKVVRVRRLFDHPRETDIEAAVVRELSTLGLERLRGRRVALTAGSRGVPNIPAVLACSVRFLQELGAAPFLVPTMGSHGGASAEGQKAVLAGYGVTEESMQCPILGEMDEVLICEDGGAPLYFSRSLLEADGVLVVNRVKPHTDFVGTIESGLCKMLAIGGGRYRGAQAVHARSQEIGMEAAVMAVANAVLSRGIVVGGLALIDNAYKETAMVRAVPVDSFVETERKLLRRAKELLPQIPFPEIDVLYLSEMGKNVSGSGSDPNVICRRPDGWRLRQMVRSGQATIGHVCCSSLTEKSRGNGIGIAFHDAVTSRLYNAINWEHSRINAETGKSLDALTVPPIFDDDVEMLTSAISAAAGCPRMVFARSTAELADLYVSDGLLPDVRKRSDITIESELMPLPVDSTGHLALWS